MQPYTPISQNVSACNCPLCGAYAQFDWFEVLIRRVNGFTPVPSYMVGQCKHCYRYTAWLDSKMIFPLSGNVPLPNYDLPNEIKNDYLEASEILNLSPRGSVALLRLALQKLCKALGEKGENINTDIKNLVSKGLPPVMQKALDSVRVIGNNAVHPGQIDLKDDTATALKLFGFINIIAHTLITQPKQISEFYDEVLPDNDKVAINKRDGMN